LFPLLATMFHFVNIFFSLPGSCSSIFIWLRIIRESDNWLLLGTHCWIYMRLITNYMLLCWPIVITHNFPGYGTVPSDWQVLWHQSLHKLSFWHDVLGCSCCNLLHKAGQNIIISSVVLVHNFWYYCSLMCCCNTLPI